MSKGYLRDSKGLHEDVSSTLFLCCHGGSKGTSQSQETEVKLHNTGYTGAGKRTAKGVRNDLKFGGAFMGEKDLVL